MSISHVVVPPLCSIFCLLSLFYEVLSVLNLLHGQSMQLLCPFHDSNLSVMLMFLSYN